MIIISAENTPGTFCIECFWRVRAECFLHGREGGGFCTCMRKTLGSVFARKAKNDPGVVLAGEPSGLVRHPGLSNVCFVQRLQEIEIDASSVFCCEFPTGGVSHVNDDWLGSTVVGMYMFVG